MTEAERREAEATNEALKSSVVYQSMLKVYGIDGMKKPATRHDLYSALAMVMDSIKAQRTRMDAIEDQLTRPGI